MSISLTTWVLKLSSDMNFISRVYSIQEPNKAFHHLKFNITLVSKYIHVHFLYHKKQQNYSVKHNKKTAIVVILQTFFLFNNPENELRT
jgi:uncharacterized protein YpiB (UPF0302 family)